jgi:hypothetical protein
MTQLLLCAPRAACCAAPKYSQRCCGCQHFLARLRNCQAARDQSGHRATSCSDLCQQRDAVIHCQYVCAICHLAEVHRCRQFVG